MSPRLSPQAATGVPGSSLSIGAGEGNRTLIISLEGCCSTIELHPPNSTSFSTHHSDFSAHSLGLHTRLAIRLRRAFSSPLRGASWLSPFGVLTDEEWWRGLDSNQRRRSQRIY